ncbi:glycosyltransferase [Pseudomonas sp. CCI3.2]|uniref:dermonecrotic toxin domain-containing protein n=1 Tax=unclassified Pseudomonas TaxID=196821 RepID=UPI002AC9A724|nr:MULTISPECIES: DUF6543 domain-containing protein [unclassified Pseudomonas]MEB0079035.1 glycosyltransferase [Pseudomonas sp. MH10out]MEB0090576.1 glycosyltransferase [Pseudomonas sp. CCI4.2]MEB0102153.1 glycosyltransferase [Pseudomonas sp. CCI3.2]MEB0130669.1 glycosyltransferase [Pseudomonas sp. CCI2.4]MEB0156742.1 glycosyltransferase [Pseudomonas sp. AH2 (2023)]
MEITEEQRLAFNKRAAELRAKYPGLDLSTGYGWDPGSAADVGAEKLFEEFPVTQEPLQKISLEQARGMPDLLAETFFKTLQINYESPEEYATETVRTYAQKKWGIDLDPSEMVIATLYIETAGRHAPFNASVAFSMTLTQAMLRNWQQNGNGDFFDHLSRLEGYRSGGFEVNVVHSPLPLWNCAAYEAVYRKTTPQRYDATTHLHMRADEFKQYVWDCNLQAHYQARLGEFWKEHGSYYHLLIKGSFLKAVYRQAAARSLTAEDKGFLLSALGLDASQPWETLTWERFVNAPLLRTVTFRELIVYRYTATDILAIRNELTGRVILYIPGNSSPFHGFDSEPLAAEWLGQQCRDPRKRKALESHFRMEDEGDGPFLSGLHAALAGLAVYPKFLNQATGYWPPRSTIKFGAAIEWPFTHFQQALKERLDSDAAQTIHTQSDYWKAAAAEGVTDAILVLGAVVMVAPEVSPLLAALSLALVGLGVDETVEGKDKAEKEQGLAHIQFGVLNALPIIAEVVAGAIDAGRVVREDAASSTWETDTGVETQADATPESLAAEEQQARLAEQARHKSIDDTERGFGIEPEGLRSLRAAMRAKLRTLEYTSPLKNGAWTLASGANETYQVFDNLTNTYESFIRLHSKVYRVEWVEAASQFRIFAPYEAGPPGPFVKELSLGRWDLDLKPGLRGGESFDGSASAPIDTGAVPVAPYPPIVLQPDIPKIQIEIPMDGVEMADDSYFIHRDGKRTRVYYDANPELPGWTNSRGDYVWRDRAGEWHSAGAADYKKIESRIAQSKDYRIYTFPRLPELPANATAIPREVHYIWMGNRIPGEQLLTNLSKNAAKSPDLAFTLHIDIDNELAFHDLSSRFINHPNVHLSRLKDEACYSDFLKSESAPMFDYFRYGDYQNLAAASDVLRYRLIYEYGGIYMDCDDIIMSSFEGVSLDAGPCDVLMGNEVSAPSFNYVGPNTSHFASLPRNPVLKELLREMQRRYVSEDPVFFTTPRPHLDTSTQALSAASKAAMAPYMIKIFELTGPSVFSDVMRKLRPDYFDLLARSLEPEVIISAAYTEQMEAARDFYFPFKRKTRILPGSANEW